MSQGRALDRIWEMVKAFVDDSSESKSKIPQSPEMGEWGRKLGTSGFLIKVRSTRKGKG